MNLDGMVLLDDVSEEVRDMFGISDIECYEDGHHRCIHIMLGWQELYSTRLPWDDAARDDVRRAAYIHRNDLASSEMAKVKAGQDRVEEQQLIDEEQVVKGVVDEVITRAVRGRLPGVVCPGVPK